MGQGRGSNFCRMVGVRYGVRGSTFCRIVSVYCCEGGGGGMVQTFC